MTKRDLAIIAAVVLAGASAVFAAEKPAIVPRPAQMQVLDGSFKVTAATPVLYTDKQAMATAEYLATVLAPATGFKLAASQATASSQNSILLTTANADRSLGEEGYELDVSANGIVVKAPSAAGLFYGCQTLRQLLPPAILADTLQSGIEWNVPAVKIRDMPRYAWRGMMLDPARHFLPVASVKTFIDYMTLHKLNTLHWHLTDDQGWRIEIREYPALTTLGSVRSESPKRGNRNAGDGQPYGPFFYTEAQILDVVAYAATRHITIVPEIEMPGHGLAALTAYPDLSCTGGPFKLRTRWGVEDDVYCAGNDKTLEFNKTVLSRVMTLFPGKFIHIGGDECPKVRWNKCPKCQARIKANGLKDSTGLQSWFVRQIDQFVISKGRRIIGWDEILEGGLEPSAAVMGWRGVKGGIEAANAGHDVVMASTSHCYFDYGQSKQPGEQETIGGLLTLAKAYSFEPTPAALAPEKKKHILGVQCNLWSEYFFEPKNVEFGAFPRACALSEVAWTPAEQRNFDDFWNRMATHGKRLDALQINWRRLTPDQKNP